MINIINKNGHWYEVEIRSGNTTINEDIWPDRSQTLIDELIEGLRVMTGDNDRIQDLLYKIEMALEGKDG